MPDPTSTSGCGAAAEAVVAFGVVTTGVDFTLPAVDLTGSEYQLPSQVGNPLYDAVSTMTNADLTTKVVDGDGIFDNIMTSINAHMKREFDAGRITGDAYSKAYTEMASAALGNGVQFLLSKDQAYWAAILAQAQARSAEIAAVTASVQLEIAKTQLAATFYEMHNQEARYGLTMMNIATEDAKFCLTKSQTAQSVYQTKYLSPAELALLTAQELQVDAQTSSSTAQTAQVTYQTANLLPAQATLLTNQGLQTAAKTLQITEETSHITSQIAQVTYTTDTLLPAQVAQMTAQTTQVTYQTDNLLPAQLSQLTAQTAQTTYQTANILPAQKALVEEQSEVQRAQTMDTRTDGITTIEGSVGKQKDLYDQQIDSYVKDAQYKAGKMYLDAWITQKTLDEGLLPPGEFTTAAVGDVLHSIREANSLGVGTDEYLITFDELIYTFVTESDATDLTDAVDAIEEGVAVKTGVATPWTVTMAKVKLEPASLAEKDAVIAQAPLAAVSQGKYLDPIA